MKIKKIVSVIAALAMSASAFAGLTVHAATTENGTTDWTALTKDTAYTDGTAFAEAAGSNWHFGGADPKAVVGDNGAMIFSSSNNSKNNAFISYLSGTTTACAGKIYRYSFNYKSTSTAASGNDASELNTAGADTVGAWGNYGGSGQVYVGSIGLGGTSAPVPVSIVADNVNNKVIYYVDGEEKVNKEDPKTNNGVYFRPARYSKTDTISNFVAKELHMPTIGALDTTDNTIETSGTKSYPITATYADGTPTITASSANTDVATATYSDGNIVVNGVGEGGAAITVTVTGNDPYEVATQTFNVTVGDVTTYDVTVNYYVTGTTTTLKTADTIANKVAGDTIAATDVTTAIDADANGKYTYNATASTALPYTVVDGDNVINIYFDKADAVTSVSRTYTCNGTVVATVNNTLTGLYVGDEYAYIDTYYVNGTDGKIYATNGDMYTEDTAASIVNIGFSTTGKYVKKVTLTANNQTIDNAVTLAPNAIFYTEGSSIYDTAVSSDITTNKNYIASGGSAHYKKGNKEIGFTAPKAGYYQIVVTNGLMRARRTLLNKIVGEGDDKKSTTLMVFGNNDNAAYGEANVTTAYLEAGAKLEMVYDNTLNAAPIDYVLIREAPVATLTTKAEYKRTAENTASLRFLASPTFADAAATATKYGFRLVHITDGNIEIKTSTVDSTTALTSGGTFHTTLEDIDITDATSFGFYAVPWVTINNSTANGDPFTYTGQLDTAIDEVVTNPVAEDETE